MSESNHDEANMTGYTVHTGSTEQFAQGWDRVFSGKNKKSGSGSRRKKSSARKSPAKKKSKTKRTPGPKKKKNSAERRR